MDIGLYGVGRHAFPELGLRIGERCGGGEDLDLRLASEVRFLPLYTYASKTHSFLVLLGEGAFLRVATVS